MAHFVVQEELARARAPELVGRIGVNLVGPTLLAHGTPAQKDRWLPRILDATELWCQLFSEPDAGSDLASLSTRAVRDDARGGWRLEGQKVWTSYAQFADRGLCLARTDPDAPRHHGISALVVDLATDGGGGPAPGAVHRTRPSSTRCSSTAPSSPTTTWSARCTRGGGSPSPRWATSGA